MLKVHRVSVRLPARSHHQGYPALNPENRRLTGYAIGPHKRCQPTVPNRFMTDHERGRALGVAVRETREQATQLVSGFAVGTETVSE
jgi:hypothetical protein